MIENDPSIEFLELFAVTAEILAWIHKFTNKKSQYSVTIRQCVAMLNNSSSKCKFCMKLIRIIVLQELIFNIRIRGKYVESKKNEIADSLSRLQFDRFYKLINQKNLLIDEYPTQIPQEIWPINKIWFN